MTRTSLRFAVPCLAGALVMAILLAGFLHPGLAWLLAINVVTAACYRYDKAVAGTGRVRVPERVLLTLEGIGGTAGAAIAMWVIRPRHKTRSANFLFRFLLIGVAQIAGAGVAWYWTTRG